MAPPCINYMEGGAIMTHPCINMSHIISTRESYPQYPWVISSVPMSHILSTHESYPQYPWWYAVPVRIEDMQYLWVISSVPMIVCSTCEDMQYLWGKFYSFFIHISLLAGTAYSHGYWGYDSSVSYMSSWLVWRWQKSDPKCRL